MWSAGRISSSGFSPGRAASASSAATAAAGAVFLPAGSRMMEAPDAASAPSISVSCSPTANRCCSLQTTMGGAQSSPSPSSRRKVSCSSDHSPVRRNSCFGFPAREAGHSRVPEPPQRMTGMITASVVLAPLRRRYALLPAGNVAATDRVVRETHMLHEVRLVEIASVEDDGLGQFVFDGVIVRAAELLPLGHDGHGIRAIQRLHG